MATISVLIVVATVILALFCLGNAAAEHLGWLRARRDADAAVERLNDHYRDAVCEMRRHR